MRHEQFESPQILDYDKISNLPHFTQAEGTWGSGNWWDPQTYDIGLTEKLVKMGLLANTPANNNPSWSANAPTWSPNNYNQQSTVSQPGPGVFGTPTNQSTGAPTGSGYPTGGGGGGSNGTQQAAAPQGGGTPGYDFGALLERQRGQVDQLYNQAKGQYDTGVNALNDKRKQFQNVFDQGKTDILQGFQKGAGEMQASAAGSRERNANAMRALGLGGSAVIRNEGRQTQNEMKARGALQNSRDTNEFQNQSAFNDNKSWADAQQSGLDSYLQQAGYNRQNAQNNVMDNLAGMFNNIINSQMSYNAAMGQKTANPYPVDIQDMTNSIISPLQGAGYMQGGQDPNAGVNVNNQMTQAQIDEEQLKKALAMYGR